MYETQQLTLQEEFRLPRTRYKSAARMRGNAGFIAACRHPALSAGIRTYDGSAAAVTGRLMPAICGFPDVLHACINRIPFLISRILLINQSYKFVN